MIFDTHAHYYDDAFDADRDEVLSALPAAPLPLAPGDRVVLMSDGVYNALSREELNEALNAPPEKAARALESAIAGKGFSDQDNYTAVILACRGGQAEADGAS